MLEMRDVCEKCSVGLTDAGEALICSFECTFCVNCGQHMDHCCPNCGGELVNVHVALPNSFYLTTLVSMMLWAPA